MDEGWEARMAARAARRERDRRAVARAAEEAQRAAEEQEEAQAKQAEFEAGPPDGCRVCYTWSNYWLFHGWRHFTIAEGDQVCRHVCHTEPLWCGPIAYAAGWAD